MKMSFKLPAMIVSGLFCVSLSVSCATIKAESMKYPVYVTNSCVIDLLAPQNMAGKLDSLYMLNGKSGQSSFYIQAYMRLDENGIFISLLNDFGTEMGSLSYTVQKLSFVSSVFPQSLKPQYVVADIQFAFYRPEAVRGVLEPAGLCFMLETKADGAEIRKIMYGKKCIEEITKSTGSVKIVNYLRGYEYDLTEASE
jgi:hypothetical protein